MQADPLLARGLASRYGKADREICKLLEAMAEVRGSVGKTVRLGRVGPGGEYAGIHVGAKLRSRKRRAEYYVGVSAGRRIPTPY